jgi:hypothetical protein
VAGDRLCTPSPRLNERLGNVLGRLEGRLSPAFGFGGIVRSVFNAVTETLPSLLAAAAASLFAMMAWAGQRTH